MEGVDIVEGQHVNELFDKVHLEIVTSTVEHRTTIAEAWIVYDTGCREGDALGFL